MEEVCLSHLFVTSQKRSESRLKDIVINYGQESLPLHEVLDISLLDLPGFKIDDPVVSYGAVMCQSGRMVNVGGYV